MNNKIFLQLAAQDGISPVLRALTAEAKAFSKAATEANRVAKFLGETPSSGLLNAVRDIKGQTGSLLSGFTGVASGITMATGALLGFNVAMGSANALTSSFVKGIKEAASIETRNIGTASDLSVQLGVSSSVGKSLVESVNKRLSEAASDLPGETKDYKAMFGAVSSAYAKSFRDPKTFSDNVVTDTKRLGVLAAKSGVDFNEAGSVANRFISGTSTFGELRKNDILQRNDMFIQSLMSEASKRGLNISNSQNWTQAQRISVWSAALGRSIPESLLAELKNSTESMLENVRTKLVDPETGMFGFLRKIDSQGGRSVLDAFKGGFTNLVNLGSQLGAIGQKLGLAIDPMATLVSGIDKVSDWALGLTRSLSSGASSVPQVIGKMLGSIDFMKLGKDVGQLLGKGLVGLLSFLSDPQTALNILKGILNAYTFVGGLVIGAAQGVIEGVLGAIKAKWNSVIETLMSLGQWLIDRLNSAKEWTQNPVKKTQETLQKATDISSPLGVLGAVFTGGLLPALPIPGLPKEKPVTIQNNVTVQGNANEKTVSSILDEMTELYKGYQAQYIG